MPENGRKLADMDHSDVRYDDHGNVWHLLSGNEDDAGALTVHFSPGRERGGPFSVSWPSERGERAGWTLLREHLLMPLQGHEGMRAGDSGGAGPVCDFPGGAVRIKMYGPDLNLEEWESPKKIATIEGDKFFNFGPRVRCEFSRLEHYLAGWDGGSAEGETDFHEITERALFMLWFPTSGRANDAVPRQRAGVFLSVMRAEALWPTLGKFIGKTVKPGVLDRDISEILNRAIALARN